MKKTKFWLILVTIVVFLIRCWSIKSYPPLLWDEAALGYNAYSILKTGRDEYGKRFPLIFKSFGDFKPGLYVYLAIPFVAIFGLNDFAVRLPSVIFGSLMPLFLYLLVKEVFKNSKLAFWSVVTLAFLPWQIHFSRGAWEVNVMTSLLVLAVYFWVKQGKLFTFHFSLSTFLLALWTYQGAKMVVPLVLLGIMIFFNKFQTNFKSQIQIFKQFYILIIRIWKLFGIWCLIFGILTLSWYFQSFSGPAKNRLKVISLFSYHRPETEVKMILDEDKLEEKNWHFYLFHGEWLHFLRGSLTRYFNHFSPRFLAFDGDWSNVRHGAPYFGMIGHVNFVLFLVGVAYFLSQRHKLPEYFFLYWLVIAPLPAAFSRDIVSGVRSLPMVIPLSVFIAYGIKSIISNFDEANFSVLKIPQFIIRYSKYIILMFLVFDFIHWADLYWVHMVKKSPKEWLYGYKESIKFVLGHKDSSKRVIFTDFYGQPYIYYLFYSQYPPQKYQEQARLIENQFGDVGRVEKIDNVFFEPVERGKAENCRHCLVVFSQDEILRSGIDKDPQYFAQLRPLGEVGGRAMFYGLVNE